jgi:phosphate:Na+ symporter
LTTTHSGLEVLLQIAGGVALLLWAARMVRTGIERAYGPALRRTLAYASRGRGRAFGAGVGVALALQSATATALLAMGFVAGGLLATAPGLAIMLGADVGSALAVQVLSLDLRWLSPLLLLVGVTLFLCTTERRARQIGRTLVGLGLILLSLGLIGQAGAAMRDSATVAAVLRPLADEPMLAFLIAGLITWGAHSSVASVLLIASLTGAGVLQVELALPMVLGANAGAGLIPMLLSLQRQRAEQRIPFGNLVFRVTGAVAALLVLPWLAPHAGWLGGTEVRQVVHFHLLFNLALAAVFVPLVGPVARLTERWLADRVDPASLSSPLANPSHLDDDAIGSPRIALTCATREVLRMADWVEAMLRRSLDALQTRDKAVIATVARMDNEVDAMYGALKHYLVKVSRNPLSDEESERCMEITAFTVKLEHLGDIVEKNLLQLAKKRLDSDRQFSPQGWAELTNLHARVIDNFQLALNVLVSGDVDTARQLIEEKEKFRALERESAERHIQRLRDGTLESIDSSPIHLDVIRDLAQINSLLASTAYPILEESGHLLRSRLRTAHGHPGESQPEGARRPDPAPRTVPGSKAGS